MKNNEIAIQIKEAFEEGYHSYATPACAYNTAESAWGESEAKKVYDKLMEPEVKPAPKVGDIVTIFQSGKTYDTYHNWPDIKYVPHFVYGVAPYDGYVGIITHIGNHEFLSELLYVIDGQFIVGPRAFEKKTTDYDY